MTQNIQMEHRSGIPSGFENSQILISRVMKALENRNVSNDVIQANATNATDSSAVLFLLGQNSVKKGFEAEPALILNKRSRAVKQPGDLCSPGGGISSRRDAFLAKLLRSPGSPLKRWPYWHRWHIHRPREARRLSILLATALREGLEEMRLNPLGVTFLGPLFPQALVTFARVIYPLVCWVPRQKRFFPNWEVEKVIYISLRNLLDPSHYACCRLSLKPSDDKEKDEKLRDVLCFRHTTEDGTEEILWGATFRITMNFLEIVFGFTPPDIASLPVVYKVLDEVYFNGESRLKAKSTLMLHKKHSKES